MEEEAHGFNTWQLGLNRNNAFQIKGTRVVISTFETLPIIVSDDPSEHVLEDYQRRWKIEVLSEALNFRGFNFEDTQLKDENRLQTLFAVFALAFCWVYHVGAWRQEVTPIRIKKPQRPAKSIFRYGLDWIRHALCNLEDKLALLTHVLHLLWQTLRGPKALVYQLYPM